MTEKIRRSAVQTFIDVTPKETTPTYELLGEGVVTGSINYNPQTEDETYIHQNSANIIVESYAPKFPVESTAIKGDPIFGYIDGLRKSRAVLTDAETTIVNVWIYEDGGPTAYPAEKQAVAIQIDEFGGEGGKSVKINYTLNYVGDPVVGTFNASTKAFTEGDSIP